MKACRRRALTDDQERVIWFALTGGEDSRPCRNRYTAVPGEFERMEPLVRMGLMKLVCEVDSPVGALRRYVVTPEGAEAAGLWLP